MYPSWMCCACEQSATPASVCRRCMQRCTAVLTSLFTSSGDHQNQDVATSMYLCATRRDEEKNVKIGLLAPVAPRTDPGTATQLELSLGDDESGNARVRFMAASLASGLRS